MFRNRKLWLFIKGAFILLISFSVAYDPPVDPVRKNIRIGLIIIFAISFIIDLRNFSKRP